MKIESTIDARSGDLDVRITIPKREFVTTKFEKSDVWIFEILNSPKLADKILALERMVRRIEEQHG